MKTKLALAPQYIFALVLAACILLGYLFYSQVIQPKQLAITTLRDDISTKQTTLSADQGIAAQVPQLTQEVAALEVEREKFLRALPDTANFGQVMADLRQTIGAAGADLKSVDFTSGVSAAWQDTANVQASFQSPTCQFFITPASADPHTGSSQAALYLGEFSALQLINH